MLKRQSVVTIALVFGLMLLMTAGSFASAPLLVTGDFVQGHENAPEGQTCVANNRYLPGQQIVWRLKVVDPETGQLMDDQALESVTVTLVDGQVFEAKYGGHPHSDPVDFYWTTSWSIPEDYPSGIVDFTVSAKASDGRTGNNETVKFPIESSMITILPAE